MMMAGKGSCKLQWDVNYGYDLVLPVLKVLTSEEIMEGDGISQKNVSWILNHICLKRSCVTHLISGLYAVKSSSPKCIGKKMCIKQNNTFYSPVKL
jgi:hypothetical protein